jgi:transcriptional regulator with XRE-family HTH domain
MKLSEMIKYYRSVNQISQRELARRCGLSNSLISLMEMGVNPQTGKEMSPDLETYRKLASGMQMTVQKLFEQLGDDATVKLSGTQENGIHVGARWYAGQLEFEEKVANEERLEALHNNPKLGMLFDRTRKMSQADVDFMLQMADRILKERDGD